MEYENKPPLIWPSRIPKSIAKNNFVPKSFLSIPASTWLFCVTFDVLLQNCAQFLLKASNLEEKCAKTCLEHFLVSHIMFSSCIDPLF